MIRYIVYQRAESQGLIYHYIFLFDGESYEEIIDDDGPAITIKREIPQGGQRYIYARTAGTVCDIVNNLGEADDMILKLRQVNEVMIS